jgi:hypothetical protein
MRQPRFISQEYRNIAVSDPLNASGCCDLVAPLLSPPARYCDHELLGRFPFGYSFNYSMQNLNFRSDLKLRR